MFHPNFQPEQLLWHERIIWEVQEVRTEFGPGPLEGLLV